MKRDDDASGNRSAECAFWRFVSAMNGERFAELSCVVKLRHFARTRHRCGISDDQFTAYLASLWKRSPRDIVLTKRHSVSARLSCVCSRRNDDERRTVHRPARVSARTVCLILNSLTLPDRAVLAIPGHALRVRSRPGGCRCQDHGGGSVCYERGLGSVFRSVRKMHALSISA